MSVKKPRRYLEVWNQQLVQGFLSPPSCSSRLERGYFQNTDMHNIECWSSVESNFCSIEATHRSCSVSDFTLSLSFLSPLHPPPPATFTHAHSVIRQARARTHTHTLLWDDTKNLTLYIRSLTTRTCAHVHTLYTHATRCMVTVFAPVITLVFSWYSHSKLLFRSAKEVMSNHLKSLAETVFFAACCGLTHSVVCMSCIVVGNTRQCLLYVFYLSFATKISFFFS